MTRKIISILLTLTLLFGAVLPCSSTQADLSETSRVYYILTVSSEQPAKKLPLYEIDGRLYMTAGDIAGLARFTLNEQADSIAFLQGSRQVTVTASGNAWEVWGADFQCPVQKNGTQWLLEAVPMLTYLGVTCEYKEPVLYCRAPLYTIFEIWDPDICFLYSNTDFDEIYGSGLVPTLMNDVVMDIIFGHGITGIANGGEPYITDALDEILNMNIFNSEAARAESALLSDRLYNSMTTSGLSDPEDIAYVESMQFYNAYRENARQYYDWPDGADDFETLTKDFFELMDALLEGTPYDDLTSMSFTDIVLDNIKDSLPSAENLPDHMLSVAFSLMQVASTAGFYSTFDEGTREILGKVFGKEPLARIGFDEAPYSRLLPVIRSYHSMLQEEWSVLMSATGRTVMERLGGYVMDQVVSSGGDFASGLLAIPALQYLTIGLDVGTIVVKHLSHAKVESASGELKARFISRIEKLTFNILVQMTNQMYASQYRDEQLIQQFIDVTGLFCREAAAYCSNMDKMLVLDPEYRAYIQTAKEDAERWFFQFGNCDASAVPVYSQLEDTLLKGKLSLESGWFDPPALTDTAEEGAFGYAVKANGDLFYMRFNQEALTTMSWTFAVNSEAVYELVKRTPQGEETVLDEIVGNNRIGRIGSDIVYSTATADSGSVMWYDTTTGETRFFDEGILLGASGTAFVYRPYTYGTLRGYCLDSLTGNGTDLGFENYLGIEGSTVYMEQNDFEPLTSHGTGGMKVFAYDLANWEETHITDIPQLYTEDMTTTCLTQFMADSDALYFALGAASGTQGLISDGILYRLDKETQELQILAEHIIPAFQLMEENGNTRVIFNYDGTDGPAKIMDARSGEMTGSVSDGYVSVTAGIGKAQWGAEGIHAFLDRTGTRYLVLSAGELAAYGFEGYDSYSFRTGDISLQGDCAYVYLCRGSGVSEYGQGEFVPESILLLEKNLDTGETKQIYTWQNPLYN